MSVGLCESNSIRPAFLDDNVDVQRDLDHGVPRTPLICTSIDQILEPLASKWERERKIAGTMVGVQCDRRSRNEVVCATF